MPWINTFFRFLWEGGTRGRNKISAWYSLLWKSWILEGTGSSINGKKLPRLVWIWTGLAAMEGLDVPGRRQHGETSSWETANRICTAYKKSGVTVWSQLLAMWWITTCTKWFCSTATQRTRDKAVTGPLDWRDPSYENGGNQIWELAQWAGKPSLHQYQGWCQRGCPRKW